MADTCVASMAHDGTFTGTSTTIIRAAGQKPGFHVTGDGNPRRFSRTKKLHVRRNASRRYATTTKYNTRSEATSRVPRLYRPMSAELRNNCACDVTVAYTPYICSKSTAKTLESSRPGVRILLIPPFWSSCVPKRPRALKHFTVFLVCIT